VERTLGCRPQGVKPRPPPPVRPSAPFLPAIEGVFVVVCLLIALVAPALVVSGTSAEPVAVRFTESATHGFLVLRAPNGEALAHGELIQAPHGEAMQSQLVLRFKDGSLHDETVTFSQNRVFRLLTYRLIQRGPAFPEAIEVWVDRASGRYRARVDDDVSEGTLPLPEDLHNGMTATLVRNLPAGSAASGHTYAFTPKPRLMRTSIRSEGEDRYVIGETARTATRYITTMDLICFTGLVAAMLGKDPPDVRFWVTTGAAPAFMKFEGPLFLKGPRWRIEQTVPRWADR
jgi:hypothetical protein